MAFINNTSEHPNAPISEVIHCGCDHVPYMSWNDELKDAGLCHTEQPDMRLLIICPARLKTQSLETFIMGKDRKFQ